jgi:hypothetical protein
MRGTSGHHFSIENIIQNFNLKLKLYIALEKWAEKLHFATVTCILQISLLGFFVNIKICP